MTCLLDRWTTGRTLERVETIDLSLLKKGDAQVLAGATILRCWRRAKLSVVETNQADLVLGYRMTGKVVRTDGPDPTRRRIRLRLVCTDGTTVGFDDTRRLGEAWVLPARSASCWLETRSLGPEFWPVPLATTEFAQRFAGTRGAIKPLLLQPARVVGIGNIGATEALWRAQIDPSARAADLRSTDWSALQAGLAEWVASTLAAEDQPEIHWVTQGGPNPFRVYGRKGEPCPRGCGPLSTLSQAGRTTVWCPGCQTRGRAGTA